jgi:ribosomal protein L11 methyltransferase
MSDEKRYPFLVVSTPANRADELGALLFELGASGVELRDDTTLDKGPGGGMVSLVASFGCADDIATAQQHLAAAEPALQTEAGETVGDAWRDKYKEFFVPFALTPHITVAPPWIDATEVVAPHHVLWMDPGRAFGTGLHATTALVAEQLDSHRQELVAKTVLDVGTGSGVLSLCALLFGASRARAVDNDPDVIEVARDNAERNGLDARLEVDTASLDTIEEIFPVVLANIRASVLMAMASELSAHVGAGGLLVLSGVLASEHDEVLACFIATESALSHEQTARRGDGGDAWTVIVLRKA